MPGMSEARPAGPPSAGPPMRVGICGTVFGQVYLEALRRPGLPFRLAGILSRGSDRSRACARRYGVPLFEDPDRFAANVDVACVVVRAGLVGGPGTELAQRLMERGVHVLQEHPLHHDELADCLRHARRHGVGYRLNSFYVHLAPVRRFVATAQRLLRFQPPLYLDAACGLQVAYALLDVLGTVLGRVGPWGFAEPPEVEDVRRLTRSEVPFRSLDGVIGGVPTCLRVQNQLDPRDPDARPHLLHRITLGTEGGNLMLATTHGPVLWSARPEIPSQVRDPGSRLLAEQLTIATDDDPTCVPVGQAEAPSHRVMFGSLWPEAAARALLGFREAILAGEDPLRTGRYHLSLCRIWQDAANRLGPPDLVRNAATPPVPVAELASAAGAGAT
jgi:pyochelin biosynthetic protein PchG